MPAGVRLSSIQYSVFKRLFFSVLSFALVVLITHHSSLITPDAFAQTATLSGQETASASAVQAAATDNTTPSFSLESPQYANLMVINLIHTFSCFAEGRSIIGQPCVGLQQDSSGRTQGLLPVVNNLAMNQGALGSINGFITNMYYTPPIRTSEYVADEFNNFGLAKPAFAQVAGSGNSVLQPVLIIWKVMRNIAYMGIILILVVIGLMIMFRQKINPQTVISAQAALPGIIIGLVLITFSYFFAALLVDLTFVATHLVGHVLEGQIIYSGAVPDESNPALTSPDPKTRAAAAADTNYQIDPIENLLKNHSILSIYNFFIDGQFNVNLPQVNSQGQLVYGQPAISGVSGRKGNLVDPTNVMGETQSVVSSLQGDHTLGKIIGSASFLGGCLVANNVGYETVAQKAVDVVGDAFGFIPTEEGGEQAIKDLGTKVLPPVLSTTTKIGAKLGTCALGGSIVAWIASNTGLVGDLAGLILYLVLMLALLIAMFRLLFALIGSYLSIMISTITAPLQFLVGSIPGRQSVITGWFKGMAANLLAFPAVFAALIFAAFIVNWSGAPFYISVTTNFWGGTLPLLGGLSSGFLRLVLAYGILLVTPQIPQMVKGALGVKDGFDFNKAVLGGAGAGFGIIKQGATGLTRGFAAERKLIQEYQHEMGAFGKSRYESPHPAQWWQVWRYAGIKGQKPVGRKGFNKPESAQESEPTYNERVAQAAASGARGYADGYNNRTQTPETPPAPNEPNEPVE